MAQEKMSATIRDVARLAGTSTATVSKVMNGSYSISRETADRVRKAMDELDYHPNLRAKNFARQSARTIVFVAELGRNTGFSNPHMFEMMCGLMHALEEKGYTLIVRNMRAEDCSHYIQEAADSKQADGFVIHASVISEELDEMIFENEEDELLRYLLREKMQGRIELMFLAQNPVKWLPEAADLAFVNVVMFPQQTPAATDLVSERLFSTYQYYFPAPTAGTPPHLLFTFQKAVNWQIQSEQRLRVQSNDLYQAPSRWGPVVDYLAVKTMESDNIFLVPLEDFMQSGARYQLTNKEGNMKNET